jgi:arabinose-5-phosphate isomerase
MPPAHAIAKDNNDIAVAARVLRTEADALNAMAAGLDAHFQQAVALIAGITGRVVVTGMGKSGHVARKIAATMASTGTPAFFVHPAEASHGDLGMIAVGDVVIALSNSGETSELGDIVAFTRRFAIPLIAMTRNAASALGEAPTTSTTLMIALGDALAVALLERRNFSAADFQVLHPGGQLGRTLLKVSDLMHDDDDVPLLAGTARMSEAILVMSAKGFGTVGIVDPQGRLAGVITDGDLRRNMTPDLLAMPVMDIMSAHPKTIRPGALAAEALAVMNGTPPRITCLFVVENERPVGIIHVHDCLRAGVV